MKKLLFVSLLLFSSAAFAQNNLSSGQEDPRSADSMAITPKIDRTSLTISPNPFTQNTTITFRLRKETIVTLEVFDIGGRIIRSFEVSEPMKAGAYSYTFDASKLRSGVYLCRLNCEGKITMKKMVKEK